MDSNKDRVRENYLRRYASRLGLVLKKSRAKKWSYNNQCGYMIVDLYGNYVVRGANFDLDMNDVDEFLNEYEKMISSNPEEVRSDPIV